MKNLFFSLAFLIINQLTLAQTENITGTIIDRETNKILTEVTILIKHTKSITTTNLKGTFELKNNLPLGEQIIVIKHEGYLDKSLPIIIEKNNQLKLGYIELTTNFKKTQEQFTIIDLSGNDIQENENQNLLQAIKDPYLKSVAYNWSSTFFKVRGLGSEYSKILINGIEMNKFYNNRPNWSNWSGLNDILKSQEATPYTTTNSQNFGDINGVSQFKMNAGAFSKSNKISLSSTNRSYQGRIMATHHSGMLPNNWSYSLSTSGRTAKQGYNDGTNSNALAFFGSVERQLNSRNNINLSFIYTPVERGKSSPNTGEVIELKNTKYNGYWGYQNGKKRNSRIKKIKEPIITVSHFWKPIDKLKIQNNLLYQKGVITNSRLDYTGTTAITVNNQTFYEGVGTNPDPTYYQKLPSYFIRTEDQENYEAAFLADRTFRNNGQIDWSSLYEANIIPNQNATYILYDDKTNDSFIAVNSLFDYSLSEKLNITGKGAFRYLNNHNYAEVIDLLGSTGYLDIDAFDDGDKAQNNLLTPNRIVSEGDDFKYNYHLYVHNANGFIQTDYSYKKWQLDTGISTEITSFQRKGNYENAHFPGTKSLGKSKRVSKLGYGLKVNTSYQINPKSTLSGFLFYKKRNPTLQNIFTNSRQSNQVNTNLQNEVNTTFDITYKYRYNGINTRFSGYYIQKNNSSKNSFFYTQDVAGLGRTENADFFQELITGINTQHVGIEFGSEIELTSTLSLQLSATYGIHRYINNPILQITTDNSEEPVFTGQTTLNNYRLPNGPQQAYGLGFNYRDPSYWWFASQLNFFNSSYINVSPFIRTSNFATDIDGLPFTDYNENRAKQLLKQEKFPSYFLWNAIGGKSWRIKKAYLGITIGIQNILNQIYKTGGFEQSRNSNYQSLNEDQNRDSPLFDSKYWHGTGTTFYLNTYLRF